MLNARLNLLHALCPDYPAFRHAVAFQEKTYDWVLSHDVAAQLYDYIRRYWHLAADDAYAHWMNCADLPCGKGQ